MTDIRTPVRRFILDRLAVDPDSLDFDDDTNLEECGIVDSFATLRLVSFIEHEFHVALEQSDVESGRLLSLARIESLVLDKKRASR